MIEIKNTDAAKAKFTREQWDNAVGRKDVNAFIEYNVKEGLIKLV